MYCCVFVRVAVNWTAAPSRKSSPLVTMAPISATFTTCIATIPAATPLTNYLMTNPRESVLMTTLSNVSLN